MSDFLADVVREVRASVEAPGYLRDLPPPPRYAPPRLSAAIRAARERGALLVEHKRVSPGSADPRLPPRPIPEFVRLAERGGAAGFSCLATAPRFDGSPGDVAELARATGRPVLFKDFVVDPRQIEAAERAHASAILLIARLAQPPYGIALGPLARDARARGLEVLLEFHARSELSLADDVPADMYGVNVRDLATLAIDRATATETLRAAADRRPLLGLSGVDGPEAAGRFWALGVDGILVGTGFARAPDPVAFLRSLARPGDRR
ncbi:MAG TPA: hypothetical protein VMG99_08585 [Thermoplasmata archaeon]|nr:hypothetical protein [Thermoplasmata archaeon]HTW56401.1 hypothetical protein [Thermoplasmata archaeon]